MATGKVIVITAPSGSGKSTIANKLLDDYDQIRLSVSATTRKPRSYEIHGKDYFFLDPAEFQKIIDENGFLEWEEFYNGIRYGTLRSEVDKLVNSGYFPLLDIDVKGAQNIKRTYKSDCVTIFVMPPSLETLKQRLLKRGTESTESLNLRLERAEKEITYADKFDYVVINKDLNTAYREVQTVVERFINKTSEVR